MIPKIVSKIVYVISFLFVIYQISLPIYAFMPSLKERSLHLTLALIIIFLGGQRQRRPIHWFGDILLACVGVTGCLYVFFKYAAIIDQYGIASGPMQVLLGIALVLIILESARRSREGRRPQREQVRRGTIRYLVPEVCGPVG